MFVGITGEPGSGKSAYAVDYIIKNKDNYHKVYVNINGFKFNRISRRISKFVWGVPYDTIPNPIKAYTIYKFTKSINWFSSLKYKPLNFPEMHMIASHCKDIYDEQIKKLGKEGDENLIDEPIIEYLVSIGFLELNPNREQYLNEVKARNKENFFKRLYLNIFRGISFVPQYLPTLFVIDEVQNHMGATDPETGKELRTADPVLTWLVSYHRHLYMDFLVLSQQYQKIHIAYRRDFSYFLHGIESQSLLLGKFSQNLVYNKHKESPYTEKNKTAKVKIKKTKELFQAYQSGDAVRTKSVILPYIILSLILLVIVIAIFSYVLSTFSSDEETDNNTTKQTTIKEFTKIEKKETLVTDYSNLVYIKLYCIKDICTNKEYKINLDIDDLNATVVNTKSKFLNVKKYSPSLGKVTLLASKDFLNLFQGANNGDKNKNTGFSLIN